MKFRKLMAGILAASSVLTAASCGTTPATTTPAGTTTAANTTAGDNATTAADTAAPETSGEKLTLKVLTHRTDRLEDGSLAEMTKAFEEANNCKVEYQGFTDYSTDIPTMMNTTEYGDVLMIPDTVKLEDLSNFFEPLGTYDEMNAKYMWADKKMYDNTVYGIAHLGIIAGGICYNKRIWQEAGVTTLPVTPAEFVADLKLIAEKTDAIP